MYRVVVIGAGVVGLTTAIRIQEELGSVVHVTICTSDLSPNTTGDVSAGLWTPYLLQKTPDASVIKWSKETQDYFHKLWREGFAAIAGISIVPTVKLTTGHFEMPGWSNIAIGCQLMSTEYLNKYRKQHKRNYTGGYSYLSFICEPSKFLPFIQEKFIRNGGTLQIRKIEKFSELKEYDVIVNCTGLYSKILVDDERVKEIRGQIARVVAPWQFEVIVDDSEDGNYVIPNAECLILGGTHQMGDTDLEPRQTDTDRIINGCHKMVPSLKQAKLIKHMVGLRPGRDEVRIELETKQIDGRLIKIVHNYGHGGSGVTLSYGCAGDATNLVKKALHLIPQSKL